MSSDEHKLREALRGLSQLSGIAPARLETMSLDELRAVHQQTLAHLRATERELAALFEDSPDAASADTPGIPPELSA